MQSRNRSLDLLRAVSMFLVLTAHFFGWGGAVNVLQLKDLNYFAVTPIYFLSQIGNTLFFLLTGYFASGNVRIRKLVFLHRKTTSYIFTISLVVLLCGLNANIGAKYVIKSLFPILTNRYWFISVYFVLYILSAPLYKGLEGCSGRMVLAVIAVLLMNNTFLYPANMTLMQGVLAFVFGYCLRKYMPFERWGKNWVFLLFCLFFGMYAAERIMVKSMGLEHTQLDEGLRYVLLLGVAITFFVFFEKLEIKARWPSNISENVLSVYLISACPPIVDLLYTQLLPIESVATRLWFVPYYFGVNILIFAVCVGIDKLVTILNNLETDLWMRGLGPARIKIR